MKIYLLDINKEMTDAWRSHFEEPHDSRICVVNDNFAHFMESHPNVEAIVSPANSFGLMDGGYDKAIVDYFGKGIMHAVQNAIMNQWRGEQPVGTSMVVYSDKFLYEDDIFRSSICQILIHTPTMRVPEVIIDPRIVYQCMRTTLLKVIREEVSSVVIPAFGGGCGKVPCDVIARMMYLAYQQICNPPKELNWGYARGIANEVNTVIA